MTNGECIFCQIISGQVPSKKIYEDEHVFAILDIKPANKGHVLLLSKNHYPEMHQIPSNEFGRLFSVAKRISHIMLQSLRAEGTNIFAANGEVAGQRAPHFMIHVIPRFENDGVSVFALPKGEIPKEHYDEVFRRLKDSVDRAFGLKQEAEKPEEKK
jgi:histidine triad (HIT) family protein